MTKENREQLYSHYKDLATNYEAPPHLNKGLTSTDTVKRNAKEHVEAMLKQHPELEAPKKFVTPDPDSPTGIKEKNISKTKVK